MLKKQKSVEIPSSVSFGRKACISDTMSEGVIRGRSLGVGWGERKNGIWVNERWEEVEI